MINIKTGFYSILIMASLAIFYNARPVMPADPDDASVGDTPKLQAFNFRILVIGSIIIVILIVVEKSRP
jgi:hypothetical protein